LIVGFLSVTLAYDRKPGGTLLKGTRTAIVQRIQPISIHGQISLDLYVTDPDEPDAQVRVARVGEESVPRGLEPGDRVILHYLLGAVTTVTRE
jgi:hypothetical protein